MFKSHFPLLIIYLFFSNISIAQDLRLKIEPKNEANQIIIDSLHYQTTHKNVLSINKELDQLKNNLLNQGYIESIFSELIKKNDSLFSTIVAFGKKYDTIYIYHHNSISNKILGELKEEVNDSTIVIPFEKSESILNQLSTKLADQGNPFISFYLENIVSYGKNSLRADLKISDQESKRTIDDIVIKGYGKFPKSYIRHFLKIKRGQSLDMSSINKKMENLNQLIFANQIKEPEILFTKDSTTLYLYLERNKSNNFDGFLGFSTNEETNKLEFNGYLNLSLTNNLNFGETFNLIYKSDESDQRTMNVNLNLPYLFGSPLGADLELNLFRKDSSFSTSSQSAKLFYQLNAKNIFYAGIRGAQSENLLENSLQSNIQDYESFFYGLRYQFMHRKNSRLFPINTLLNIGAEAGNRLSLNESTSQYQISLNTFKIINLNNKNSFYVRVNGSYLMSNNYFDNELVRFGGINSIRGFEENSLEANLYGLLNTEYRYILADGIYLHTIIDLAYLENDITLQKNKLYGFGLGFGLLTNAGLLKFNYANGKTEDQSFQFSNSQVHISLTAYF